MLELQTSSYVASHADAGKAVSSTSRTDESCCWSVCLYCTPLFRTVQQGFPAKFNCPPFTAFPGLTVRCSDFTGIHINFKDLQVSLGNTIKAVIGATRGMSAFFSSLQERSSGILTLSMHTAWPSQGRRRFFNSLYMVCTQLYPVRDCLRIYPAG